LDALVRAARLEQAGEAGGAALAAGAEGLEGALVAELAEVAHGLAALLAGAALLEVERVARDAIDAVGAPELVDGAQRGVAHLGAALAAGDLGEHAACGLADADHQQVERVGAEALVVDEPAHVADERRVGAVAGVEANGL